MLKSSQKEKKKNVEWKTVKAYLNEQQQYKKMFKGVDSAGKHGLAFQFKTFKNWVPVRT